MKHPTKQDVERAAENLAEVVAETPLYYSKRLSKQFGAEVYIKREDLQEVRSFKIRGAYNRMSLLSSEEKNRGVVCASAGNHAQGVAYSCSLLKVKGTIFMPEITPNQKVEKVRQFGGKYVTIKLVGQTFDDASVSSQAFCKESGAVYVHPFNDPQVIAGQGTAAHEVIRQLGKPIDYFFTTEGGGGLISGCSIYLKSVQPKVKIIGVEPEGAAGMVMSLKHGKVTTLPTIDTFVDGAAVKTEGELTFDICKKYVDEVVTVPEGKVCTTMIELYQNEGIIAEPAGALAISALDQFSANIKGKTVVCMLSGGNNDLLRYPEIVERSLVYLGRKHYFLVEFAQKPGQLKKFVNYALGPKDDIVLFEYIKKNNKEKGPALVGIELQDKADFKPLLARMEEIELNYTILKSDNVLYKYLI